MASGSVERKWAGKGGLQRTCVALEGGACMSIHPSRSCVHNRSRKAAPDAPKHEAGAHGQVERAGVFQVRGWEGRGGGGGRRLKGAWTLAVSGGVGCRWNAGWREGDGREGRWHVCRMLAWQWQGGLGPVGMGGERMGSSGPLFRKEQSRSRVDDGNDTERAAYEAGGIHGPAWDVHHRHGAPGI